MQHLKDQLAELRLCLAALPTDIPIPKESKYKFSNFTLDAEWTADIGEAAAVDRELEVRLGSRVNGLKFVERGPEMEAIVHVFETWAKKFPGDVILEKWVNDTLEAARGLILAAGKAPCHLASDPTGEKNMFGALPAVAVTSHGHGQELDNTTPSSTPMDDDEWEEW
ncbi:hypothetical protein F4604DRAFT_1685363 [Suillus subluteus]|nr:hypothetical protein F4604DRAFT_1685363 [Suillus subluteus]